MPLQEEIGLRKPLRHRGQETLLNIIVTSSILMGEAQRVLSGFGLTESQLNVLMMLLYQSEDGRLTQTQLSRMLVVKRSGITGLVDRMEKAGLVRRIPDPADRRVNLIEMTEQGRDLLDRAHGPYFRRIEEVASALTDEEHDNLNAILERVRRQVRGTGD